MKLVYLQENPLFSNIKIAPWVRIRIGRSDCAPGWGVCDVTIFGITIMHTKEDTPPLQENEIDLPIVLEKDKVYSHLLFAEDVSQYNLEELTFIVEEDLIAEDVEGNIIKLLAGNYSYNPALGSFGGYEINFNIDSSI